MSRDEGFLTRWSRLKRGQEPEPAPEPDAAPPAAAAPEHAAPPEPDAAPEAEPEFDPASLPPVESLTAESDLAPFLRPRVPAALRQAALRRIWSLDPAIRDYIGPAEYAWDFNAPDGVTGFSLELGEEVGRRLLALLTGPATTPPEADVAVEAAPPAPPTVPEAAPLPAPPVVVPPQPAPLPPAEPPMAADPSPPPRRRHGGAVPI